MIIYAVCYTQNEQDVIESLCRYYTRFCDGMIVCDNRSTDNTPHILRQLAAEGLNIILADELREDRVDFHITKQRMAQMAFERFGANLVIQVDADEFLFCADGTNPRYMLETFNPSVEYRIPWRSYVYSREPDDNTRFLPDYFPQRASEEYPQFYKTVMSDMCFRDYGCYYTEGGHAFEPRDAAHRQYVPVEHKWPMFYAHYPIRSRYQAIFRAVRGGLEALELHGNQGYQHNWAIEKIMQTGGLSAEDVAKYSLTYTAGDYRATGEPVFDPPKCFFSSEALRLRYTDYRLENEATLLRAVVKKAYEITGDLVKHGRHLT